MSSADCNSSIASSTTTTSLGSIKGVSKKRLSGIKKFKSKLMRRSKSGDSEQSPGSTSEYLRGGSIGSGYEFNAHFDSPQDLPGMIVEDLNASMETVAYDIMVHDEKMPAAATPPKDQDYFANNCSEKSSENDYCPFTHQTTQESSPNSQSVEDYINNQMDVAPYSPNRVKSSPSSTTSTEGDERNDNEMQFSSACGPSPAKLELLDLSLNDSSFDGVYEEDNAGADDVDDERDQEGDEVNNTSSSGVSFINVLPRVAVMDKKKKPVSDATSDVRGAPADVQECNASADGLSDTVEVAQEITAKDQSDELKIVGRKESIDSKQTTDDEDTFDGWKNVGTQDMDTDGSSVRSSSIDLADGSNSLRSNSVDLTGGKHPSDGFLDEYPTIVDEGKESDVKSVRFVENEGATSKVEQSTPAGTKQSVDSPTSSSLPLSTPIANRPSKADEISPPTTVSASDCMAQFSSARGPSPVKLKSPHSRDYFNFDISMETSMESSAAELDQSNKETMDDSTKSDDNVNVWNGNGIDIAIDEAGEDSTLNESCTDTDVAADESTSLKGVSASASGSRSEIMSPLTIDGTIQQEESQQMNSTSTRSLRRGKKQNCDLPTTTSMLHLEYNVDHSCSTPLERLARDIGNVLRQWNVHNGCDRHVPLDWMEQIEVDDDSDPERDDDNQHELDKSLDTERIEKAVEDEMTVEANQIMSMDLCMNRFANRSRRINEWMGEDTAKMPSDIDVHAKELEATVTPVKETTKPKQQPESKSTPKTRFNTNRKSGAQCIRSKKITFETIGFTPQNHDVSTDESVPSMVWTRRRYSIPLLLCLWDAPPIPKEHNTESWTEDELSSNVPLSLRPDASYSSHALLGELGVISHCGTNRAFYEQSSKTNTESSKSVAFGDSSPPLDTGFGRDLSSLFSIGQHITLSLDIDSAQYSSKYNQDSKHLQDIQALYDDIRAYLTDTIEQALEEKALAEQERQRCLKRQRKRALRNRNFNTAPVTDEYSKHSEDVVPVGSQSMSIDVEGEEEVLFDQSDKENQSESYNTTAFDDEHSSSDDDTLMMSLDDELRLNETEIHNEAMSTLSSLIQNAMNLAATESKCCIPVFGLWGSYKGASRDKEHSKAVLFAESGTAASSWIPSATSAAQDHKSKFTAWEGDEAHFKKLVLSSPIISGHCQRDLFRSTHRVYSVSRQILPLHLSTLHGLSCVLLAQCPPQSDTNRVLVTSARHCYHIDVPREKRLEQTWRMAGSDAPHGGSATAIQVYKETCRRQASFLLERASSPWVYKSVPMWGPSEGNPLLSLSASVSWGVVGFVSITNDSQEDGPDSLFSPAKSAHSAALLQLPLKIRSSNFVPSPSELLDMEYSLQSAAFDPLGTGCESKDGNVHFGPREPIFFASAKFDSDLPCATLSANVRCVLAALLRCGSLGPDALPGHLTRKEILRKLGGPLDVALDEETNGVIGTMAESEAMLRAGIKHVGPVTSRLVEAMDWAEVGTISTNAEVDRGIADALQRIGAGGLYPAPPEEIFAQYHNDSDNSATISPYKGSPPGRLLSILFAHMARLRTPPSMMSLWLAFVEELRSRWDSNESLPNLGFVPGLDEDVLGSKQSYVNNCPVLGHRAHLAAFVNSSEPDPDRQQCIINQKLQVFNICIESKIFIESQSDVDELESMEEGGTHSNSDSDEFFDPEEEEVDFGTDTSQVQTGSNEIETMLKMEAAAVTNPGLNRNGARCPVPNGLPLIETGGQVYAPYLQRTMPMTDEEEEKQNKLFGKGKQPNNERLSIRDRIEISQRLQTPKLMSDMSAFKAANPECIFEDFVSWYGNPQNPLSEEVNGESVRRSHELRSNLPPEAAKVLALEEASEAIAILMSLRTFWEDSFEEAEPCPASEQQPLFDPYSTVEMVLHSFETIHPSLLMGQALSVNLMNAEFVLETYAKPVIQVPLIAQALIRTKTAIRDAMEQLTNDASDGCLHTPTHTNSDEHPLVHVSASTIQQCEQACDKIGELELLLSRALALWQLCPCAELVNSLLQCQGGSFVLLKSPKERSAFLNAIKQHQSTHVGVTSDNHFPEASMREYVIRNGDQDSPCQLNARLVSAMNGEHSALLALTKSSRD